MAMVSYGMVLEYATNTITLSLYGDNNEPIPFGANTTFSIRRIDDENNAYSTLGWLSGNSITFTLNPPLSLKVDGDSSIFQDDGIIHHIYSVKDSTNVYMQGKVKLVEVA